MRRALGRLLTAAGGALLLASGGTYLHGAVARSEARSRWEAEEARRASMAADSAIIARLDPAAIARRGAGAPVALLRIPAIGVDEVVVEGVGDRELNVGPGHLPGSPLPGFAGNAILSAHRDRHFDRLDELAVGDTIVTESAGRTTVWRVDRRRVVDKDAPALFASREPMLTLTTCWPVRYTGPAPDRLIITALPLRPPPSERPTH